MAKDKTRPKAAEPGTRAKNVWVDLAPSFRVAAWAWLAARIVTVVGAWIGVALIPAPNGTAPAPSSFGLITSFFKWDSGWYQGIAQSGYKWVGLQGGQQNVAFFPLYPTLTRIVGAPFPASAIPTVEILLSWLAFFAALVAFHRLARIEMSEEKASVATFFLALLPGAVFYFMGYSEALFLLCTVLTFLYARRGQWWVSAIFAFLAALTRSTGFLLVVPLALEWIQQRRETEEPLVNIQALSLAGGPLGLGAFSAYLYFRFGDVLAWVHAQEAWRKMPMWFGATLYTELGYIVQQPWWALLPHFAEDAPMTMLFDWLMMLITVALLLVAVRRLRWGYLVWSAVLLLAPLQTGQSWNMVRFSAIVFPAALAYGLVIKNSKVHTVWIATSVSLLVLATATSLSGRFLA